MKNLAISAIAKGATAQLRAIVSDVDHDTARQLHAELLNLAAQIGRKYGFDNKVVRVRQRAVVVVK